MAIYKGETQLAGVLPVDSSITEGSGNAISSNAVAVALKNIKTELFNSIYPVGSIYVSMSGNLPEAFIGTWERIPNEYYLVASDTAQGTALSAELPNIKGTFMGGWVSQDPAWTGAFKKTGSSGSFQGGTDYSFATASFDANNYNTTYKDDGKVQPKSIQCSMWKRTA